MANDSSETVFLPVIYCPLWKISISVIILPVKTQFRNFEEVIDVSNIEVTRSLIWYDHSTKYACQIFYAWYILSFRKNGFALLLKAFGLLLIQTKLEQGTNQGSHFAWLFVHWWYFIAVKTFVFMYNLTVDIALYFSASAMTKLWHYYTKIFVKMFFIVHKHY